MGLFGSSTDQDRRAKAIKKQAQAIEKEQQRRTRNIEKDHALAVAATEAAARAFWQSAQGRARTAKTDGQTLFQLMLPLASTSRAWNSLLFGDVATTTRNRPEQGAVLTQIESEGWELLQAGYVFQETGAVSRDKFLSSGQEVQTTGDTQGVYLFRATSAAPREDTPWITTAS
jgi:hypothetical protein